MPSTFTWLDNSESDRRRALEVIDLFAQPGTLDELGIGTIRDALADQMFPGTSTIQTRARYFLFIPWIYLDLERRRVPSAKISELARQEEIRLARSLAENEADASGVIGKEAGRHLKRLPSAIYWSGLQRWGLRQSRASQDSYHRSLDRLYADQRAWREAGHDREGQSAPPGIWHPHIPDPPSDFPDAVNFALGREEVEYLQDRIRAQARGSLLGCLRCLLLVMCTYPFAKKALTLYLARSEGHERYFGCNLMQCKVLASSHQHLIAEAPGDWREGPSCIGSRPYPACKCGWNA